MDTARLSLAQRVQERKQLVHDASDDASLSG